MKLKLVKTRGRDIKKGDRIFKKIKTLIEKNLTWDMPVWRIKYILGLSEKANSGSTFEELRERFVRTYPSPSLELEGEEEKKEEIRQKEMTDTDEYGRDLLQLFYTVTTSKEAEMGADACRALFDTIMFTKLFIELAQTKEELQSAWTLINISEVGEYYFVLKKAAIFDLQDLKSTLASLEVWHPARKIILQRIVEACKTLEEVNEVFDTNSFGDAYGINFGSDIAELCQAKCREISHQKRAPYRASNYAQARRAMKRAGSERFDETYKEMARLGSYQILMKELLKLSVIEGQDYIFAYRCVELSKTTASALKVANLFMDSDDVFWKAISRAAEVAKTSKEIDQVLEEIGEWYNLHLSNPIRLRIVEKRIKMAQSIADIIKFCKKLRIEDDTPEQIVVIKRLYKLLK